MPNDNEEEKGERVFNQVYTQKRTKLKDERLMNKNEQKL